MMTVKSKPIKKSKNKEPEIFIEALKVEETLLEDLPETLGTIPQEQDTHEIVEDNVEVDRIIEEEENKVVEEKIIESIVPEVQVTVIPIDNKPLEPRKVRVRMKETHKCFIGGEWYCLGKGGIYSVPENVKDILVREGLLLPL